MKLLLKLQKEVELKKMREKQRSWKSQTEEEEGKEFERTAKQKLAAIFFFLEQLLSNSSCKIFGDPPTYRISSNTKERDYRSDRSI